MKALANIVNKQVDVSSRANRGVLSLTGLDLGRVWRGGDFPKVLGFSFSFANLDAISQ